MKIWTEPWNMSAVGYQYSKTKYTDDNFPIRKCWLRETLETVEKLLSSISIPITVHLSRFIRALILKFGTQKHWVFEKN